CASHFSGLSRRDRRSKALVGSRGSSHLAPAGLSLTFVLPELPRRYGILVSPQAPHLFSGRGFRLFQQFRLQGVCTIPPREAIVNHFDVDVPVAKTHIADDPPV